MIAMISCHISKAANAMSASHINDEDLSSGPHFTPAQNDDITSYTESYTESCTESYTELYTESCTSLFRRVCKCGSDQEAIKASPKHGRVSAARTQTRVCPIDSPISLQFPSPKQTNKRNENLRRSKEEYEVLRGVCFCSCPVESWCEGLQGWCLAHGSERTK